MSLGPSSEGVLGGDPLVYEEHASPHGGCDLTVNSPKLQANWQDEDNAHGVVSAGLQEVSSVRGGETLKWHVALDSKIASVSMKILALHRVRACARRQELALRANERGAQTTIVDTSSVPQEMGRPFFDRLDRPSAVRGHRGQYFPGYASNRLEFGSTPCRLLKDKRNLTKTVKASW